jgi:hypothetical protein
VELLIEHVATRPDATELLTSCHPGAGSPEGFYRTLGFERTGRTLHGEIELRLALRSCEQGVSSMTRRGFRISIIAILIGTSLNVAVAWLCALSASPLDLGANEGRVAYHPALHWRVARVDRPGIMIVFALRTDESPPPLDHLLGEPFTNPGGIAPAAFLLGELHADFHELRPRPAVVTEDRTIHAFGWPLASLWYEQSRTYRVAGTVLRRSEYCGALETSFEWSPGEPKALPLRPLWSGFVVNALLYAFLVAGLIHTLPMFRRRGNREGTCQQCQYPIGPSERCPECGFIVRT